MAAATNVIRGTCTFDQHPFGAMGCCPTGPSGAAALPEETCGVLFQHQHEVETEPVSLLSMGSLGRQEAPEGLVPCHTTTETTASDETATGDASTCSRSAFLSDEREDDSPPVQFAFLAKGASQAAGREWAAAATGSSPATDSDAEALPAQLGLLDLNCVDAGGAPDTGAEASHVLQGTATPSHHHQPQPVGRAQSEGDSGKRHWAPRENGHERLIHSASPSGLKPNAVSYGCILDALVSNGALDLALKLLAEMKASDQAIRPNTVMYSTLIKGCAQSKQASSTGNRTSAFTLRNDTWPHFRSSDLDQALALFEEMSAQGIEVNTVTYNSLLDVCARVGAMDRAAMLLDDMLKNGVKPDLITFSTIIKGYCAHGQMDKGLFLLKAMKQKNISPDGVLYNSLLDGCVRAGAQQIKPSNFTLSILIKLHGRMRQLQVAFELVKHLPKMYDFQLNAHVYTCLMAACIENRQYRAAYNVLQNMRREGVAADSKTISTIVFGCLKGRMHAQAVEVVLNALESLRHLESQGFSGQSQRGRQGTAGSSSRRQSLPVIDEKTVRLLAYHLRDQHMHQECNLVLDTAVSVGVMSRAAAQALLAGDGHGDRCKSLAAMARASLSGMHVQPHARGPRAPSPARLSASCAEQPQGNLFWIEAAAARKGSEAPCRGAVRNLREEGECQEQAGDVTPADRDFLTFSSSALCSQQGDSGGACEGHWSQQDKHPRSEASTAACFRLQPAMAGGRPQLGMGMAPIQPSLLPSNALSAPSPPLPTTADAAPRRAEGASASTSPVLVYGQGVGAPRTSQGLPPTHSMEDWIAPPHVPKGQHPGLAWTLPTVTSPTCALGRSNLAVTPPRLDPHPPSRVIRTPANEPAGLLEAGGAFVHEDACRLPGLPLSWPLYPLDNLLQASCPRASFFQ
ncbi:hypothetical protein ACSSS7_006906 [Eimeria intestinalis]